MATAQKKSTVTKRAAAAGEKQDLAPAQESVQRMVIYDSPMKPRHLTLRQIQAAVNSVKRRR